uniref:glycosyltransferase family 4 protein n=1 Tax=Kribbia dieselivorans TaxID=331526 RepID=UPI0012EEB418
RGLRGHLVQWLTTRRADLVTGASSDLVASAQAHGARRSWAAEVPSPRVPRLLQAPLDALARDALRTELLAPLPVDPTGPLVVTVCSLDPQHRIPDLLDAAAEVESGITWVVIGDGDLEVRETLQQESVTRALPVHLVEETDPDTVTRWLQAADLFVLPSSWDARPMAVQDAMAAGTPVIATDVGGLRDLVDGVGLLVPVGDPAALGGAVDAILQDPTWHAEMVQAGRTRAATWHDDDETAQRWHQWYIGPYP